MKSGYKLSSKTKSTYRKNIAVENRLFENIYVFTCHRETWENEIE